MNVSDIPAYMTLHLVVGAPTKSNRNKTDAKNVPDSYYLKLTSDFC